MGIYKRGKVWWMSFIYFDRRVRQSTNSTDRKLAEKIFHKAKTQVAEGKWFPEDEEQEKTFNELADEYDFHVFRELKSWKSCISYFNQLKDFFGSYTLAEINPALIDEFKRMRKSKGVKPATINRQLNILRRMLNLAKNRWLWIKEVPYVEMEPKADKKRIRHLSFDEFHLLLDCCEEWLKGIVVVAAWTGLRRGNIINLQRNQINLFAKTIMLESDDMKNEENLTIPISAPALEVLKSAMKVARLKNPYIFCDEDGSPYAEQRVYRGFKRAAKSAGIEDLRFHDLRHCFASWNRQAGVDIDTLADLMGHKDTRMTRRYAHITPVHLRNAVDLLEKSYQNSVTIQSQSQKKELAVEG